MVPQTIYNGNIINQWSPNTIANNNNKIWNIILTKLWYSDIKWANAIGKMVPVDMLHAELPQNFNL